MNETCERCAVPNCEVRAALPTRLEQDAARRAYAEAVAALVRA
ncbi:hypothetical protein [Hymenobacter sp. PAMC 26628]|nr:hypothetical protein [Hymenobacter sp. PAMC 26628]